MMMIMMMMPMMGIMTNINNHNHNQGNIIIIAMMTINRGHGDMMMMINDYDLYTRRINLLDQFIGTAYNCL